MKKYFKLNTKLIILNNLLILVQSLCLCAFPLLLDYVITNYLSFNTSTLLLLIGSLLGAVLLIVLVNYAIHIVSDKLSYKTKQKIREDIFNKLLSMDVSSFKRNDLEYYINLQVNELDTFYETFFESYILLISSIVQVVAFFVIMIVSNWALGLVAVAVSILAVFIPKLVGKKLDAKRKTKIVNNELYLAKLLDLLKGKELIPNQINNGFVNEHHRVNENKSISDYSFNKYYSFINVFSDISTYLVMFSVLAVGMIFVYFKISSVGILLSIFLISTYLLPPLNEILYYIIAIKSSKPYIDEYSEILGYSNYVYPEITFSKIEVKELHFERENFSLNIPNLIFEKGKKYAIIGKNGSGKSTFFSILSKTSNEFEGSILVDDKNLFKADTQNSITFMNQSNYVFNASLKDNITLFGTFKYCLTDEDIKTIGLDIPMDYVIGTEGEKISGGEKEKLSILRCINKRSNFICLDESFASIDKRSTEDIKNYLFKKNDIALIEITHDITYHNLCKYDHVIVFKKECTPQVFSCKDEQSFNEICLYFDKTSWQ